uniref:MND1-interacting protein 1 n=1 Tax=Cajanus cajan TaxID=3821 RepID=A0A151U0L7_CAJCA|nr:MND1-interacting protein 1 [Cajanus cajan]
MAPSVSVQEKGSRNKRKFRADPPLGEPNKIIPSLQNESLSYEFSAEKFEITAGHVQASASDSDGLKLDLGLSSSVTSTDIRLSQPKEELEVDEYHDADWSDLTEAQLEELVLENLHTIFKSAIKKLVACGYTEDVATKAILRSGICYGCSQSEKSSSVTGNTCLHNSKNSQILAGLSEKESANSGCESIDKSSSAVGTSQSPSVEERCGTVRKVHSSHAKRDHILRQKSFHMEKGYRTYGSKGSSRGGRLNGLILDKKLKSVSESNTINLKSASLNISKAMGVDVTQNNLNADLSSNDGPSTPIAFSLDSQSTDTLSPVHEANAIRAIGNPNALSVTDTDLSLSLSSKSKSPITPVCLNNKASNSSCLGIPYDKSLGQWIPQDRKDEMILKLVPRVRELQNQLQEWTEWANQKVMQAARENAVLRKEMEDAKLHATESATNCQEVSSREKMTQMKLQSWEKQKSLFQEELMAEKHKLAQLQQALEQAKVHREQVEVRWQQAAKAKEELLLQASSIRKEREQIEESAKSKEDMIKLKAEENLQRYRDDIQKLEKEIAQLRQKTDSSKIAALRRGIDGSYMHVKRGGVKRERECVMCLSEEMSVVFLPCAHQVVCTTCNELHEKQGMQDCPSCRSPIQKRISVRFART